MASNSQAETTYDKELYILSEPQILSYTYTPAWNDLGLKQEGQCDTLAVYC